jgi:hypothetical protein
MPPLAEIGNISGVEVVREGTRRVIAYIAIGSYFAILALIAPVSWVAFKLGVDDVLKVLTTTAGVLGGVVGAVVGFYFRSES